MAQMDADQFQQFLQNVVPGGSGGRRLPTFSSGLPDDWVAFLLTLENCFRLRGWFEAGGDNEERRKNNLVAAMEGTAARAVSHIDPEVFPGAAPTAPYTYDQLKAAYAAVFLPAAASHLAMTQYNVARQADTEPLLAWHTRLRELFSRAYPNAEANTSLGLINRFILGLAHPVVRDRTWDAHPDTFQNALNTATSKAAGVIVMQQAATGSNRRNQGSVGSLGLGLEVAGAVSNPPSVGAVDGGRGRRRRGAGNTCFNCGSPDHFKRDCPSLPPMEGRPGRGRRGGARGTQRGNNRRDASGRFTNRSLNALVDMLEGLSLEDDTNRGNQGN